MARTRPGFDVAAFERDLRKAISGEVRFDSLSRALYSTDASVYRIRPLGVVLPKTRDEIVRIVELCHQYRCPITMRGGGTSQAGQAIGEGIIVDTSKYMGRVLEVNAEERWARVEPGVVLAELNAELAPLGLKFAPDISTASRATVGGMMANNSAGARSVLYGKTIDHVLEQTVVLSDGSVTEFRSIPREEVPTGDTLEARIYETALRLGEETADEMDRRYPKILRRVGGYNLNEFVPAKLSASGQVDMTRLMVGSEGTLGVVLEAKLNLVPLPKAKAVVVICFHDLLEALSASPVILKHHPSAVEVMDAAILNNTRQNEGLDAIRRTFMDDDAAASLCIEFYGDHPAELPPRIDALIADLKAQNLGYHFHPETDATGQARVWSLREAALGLSMAVKDDAKSISFVEDTAVAPERLSEFIGKFLDLLRAHGTTAGIYAHASVGCLHVRPVVNMKTAEGVAKFEAIANEVAALVLEYGGALSGEHGDGLVRGPFMRQMFGEQIYEAFREIKRTADPHNILNPGKIVDSPPMTQNLRFGPNYRAQSPSGYFDYSSYGSFAQAVEMCSGVGACRKKLAGTMCPSYMATREEADSTRGRANALRLAMSGELGDGLTDQAVKQALSLCLECRACKTECPVGVDVARFKSEFLAAYHSRHGIPARARALGGVARLAEWGSRFAPIANAVAGSAPARWFNQQVLGIDTRRTLPAWQSETLEKWAARRARKTNSDPSRRVMLFADTFVNHYEPEIGRAAVELLESAGYQVDIVRPGCCGRPLISQGLLKEAQGNAAQLATELHRITKDGQKLLVLEPSCLTAIQEDIPDLLRGEARDRAQEAAAHAMFFEEFAAGLDFPLLSGPERILLHGHCHQKSLGLVGASKKLLEKIPAAQVVDLDAGCCGMAGSFGYTSDHYDVSVAIANRKLIPAVESMGPADRLAAPGTSCRHQVADLAGVKAEHPASLLRSLLRE